MVRNIPNFRSRSQDPELTVGFVKYRTCSKIENSLVSQKIPQKSIVPNDLFE
jgi:hypothetical protein